ncbi:DoxX-like family protein [Aquimarina sp. 2201CG14-23]|uniref:DoxX-like family protein n=1 Tax=Aquimarina mycalae TaxID=3040073 RepID=UPI002477D897|nr:DoxX-like family protein [Aquimarina sp. 2201CG14-23]MDH7447124.1 DoxX-like family protein [Aquimarina sp. 2201CG14-23]
MQNSKIHLLLKVSVFLIFIGRAWQHLFWDAPYRSFFWDESLLQPIIEGVFNTPWQEYATSPRTDTYIQNGIRINGILYLLAGLSALMIHKNNLKWLRVPLFLGACSLVLLTVLLTKEKFYHTAQFFEHSIQFGLPFIFLYSYSKKLQYERLVLILKVLIAFTFFSHGLYAFGFYPVPGKFVDMVIQIFGVSESVAIQFLYLAGILDFILAVLIFIPRTQIYALWYAVIWGLLTALARIVANFYWDFPLQSIHQNLYEVLYRLPHGFTPLLVILMNKEYRQYQKKKAVHNGQPSS